MDLSEFQTSFDSPSPIKEKICRLCREAEVIVQTPLTDEVLQQMYILLIRDEQRNDLRLDVDEGFRLHDEDCPCCWSAEFEAQEILKEAGIRHAGYFVSAGKQLHTMFCIGVTKRLRKENPDVRIMWHEECMCCDDKKFGWDRGLVPGWSFMPKFLPFVNLEGVESEAVVVRIPEFMKKDGWVIRDIAVECYRQI